MRLIGAALFILATLLSCGDLIDDSSPKFPECAGIKESFNPYNIVNPYSGKIWGADTTFYTLFIFTNYVNYNLLLTAEKSWTMWVKFTSGTITRYQSGDCYYSFSDGKWYGWTGFDYRGQYASWDFKFEKFDCSKLSGSIKISRPEKQDTLNYRFEGTR